MHSGYLVYVGTIGAYSRWFSRQLGSTQPRGALFAAGTSEGGSGGRPGTKGVVYGSELEIESVHGSAGGRASGSVSILVRESASGREAVSQSIE